MQRSAASVATGDARRASLSVGAWQHLAVTDELGLTICRALDRVCVDARLFWSAGACLVGRPLQGRGLAGHRHRGSLKARLKRCRINETKQCRRPVVINFSPWRAVDARARLSPQRPSTVTALPTCTEHYWWPRTPSPRPLHARRSPSTSARALCNRNSCTASLDESRRGACPHP